MPISRTRVSHVREQAANLCWGAWAELGVSGWVRTHQNWAIDPEPLIVFTAGVGDSDPRLRDEAMDWCIRNWRHISLSRLRNILAEEEGGEFLEKWGTFAATVNARAGVHWPEATDEQPRYRVTGRSILRPLTEPSLVVLRMRAIFGLSARTEILRYFLLNPDERVTTAMLADITSYQKRNVAEACDFLALAGVLTERSVRNRFYYSLANEAALEGFVGSTPEIMPDWNALFRVVGAIMRVADAERELSNDAFIVEVHQAIPEVEIDLDELGLDAPRWLKGAASVGVWESWSCEVMNDLASGRWPDGKTRSTISVISTRSKNRRAARVQ